MFDGLSPTHWLILAGAMTTFYVGAGLFVFWLIRWGIGRFDEDDQ